MIILGGSVSVRVHQSGGLEEGFGISGDGGAIVEASSFGEELRTAAPGHILGANELLNVRWDKWG